MSGTIYVDRFNRDDRATMGRVVVAHADGSEETIGFSLEDRHRESKVPGDTAIPAGTYRLEWRTAGKWAKRFQAKGYQGSLEICDVPDFSAVLAHYGNTVRDTAGCLLAGRLGDLDTRTIGKSRAAIDRLYELVHEVGGTWEIVYRDP